MSLTTYSLDFRQVFSGVTKDTLETFLMNIDDQLQISYVIENFHANEEHCQTAMPQKMLFTQPQTQYRTSYCRELVQ